MRPFGFDTDRVSVRADEADLIRDAAQRIAHGESLRSVATDWNRRGFPTPAGNQWRGGVIKRMLAGPRLRGQRITKDGETIAADWPAIIDADTSAKLDERFASEDRRNDSSGSVVPRRTYLLTGGLAVCGLCGSRLISRPDNSGRRGYVCASGSPSFGCGRIRINGALLDEEVSSRVLARLLRDDAAEKLAHQIAKADEAGLSAPDRIKSAEARMRQLGEDYAVGRLSGVSAKAATDKLQAELASARSDLKLAEALQSIAALDADDLVLWWEEASIAQQRALLSTLVSSVKVLPAIVRGSRKFDARRVRVNWKR